MAQVFYISENNVREAWLSAVAKVYFQGDDIKTEYDDNDDKLSKDATVMIEIKKPMSHPIKRKDRLIKINTKYGNRYEVYGCMADTYLIGSIQSGYIEEIMDGKNDHYIWDSGQSFPYSYHDRIFSYKPYSLEDTIHKNYDLGVVDKEFVRDHQKLIKSEKVVEKEGSIVWKLKNGIEFELDKEISEQIDINRIPMGILQFPEVDQISYIIKKLKKYPYSRRAQAITWRPLVDPYHNDPPCLQRIYMRVKNGKLIMQTTWRSRDLFRAWEANVNGMLRIQKYVADELEVEMGHYLDFANSLHIYGDSFKEVEDLFERMRNKDELPEDIIQMVENYS
ncbi:MAG: thymidylate synthase [Promethearchaeia archaeon]